MQVCTAAMLDKAIGPTVIGHLLGGFAAFLQRHADKGWTCLEDFRGLRRDRVVVALADPPARITRVTRAATNPPRATPPRNTPDSRDAAAMSTTTTLVTNGTIITAADRYQADLYIENGVITLIGRGIGLAADTTVDASGTAGDAGRHRRAHAPRHAVWRHPLGRRLRVGHDRRRARRHDDAGRLRHPGLRRRPVSRPSKPGWAGPRARASSTTAST